MTTKAVFKAPYNECRWDRITRALEYEAQRYDAVAENEDDMYVLSNGLAVKLSIEDGEVRTREMYAEVISLDGKSPREVIRLLVGHGLERVVRKDLDSEQVIGDGFYSHPFPETTRVQ